MDGISHAARPFQPEVPDLEAVRGGRYYHGFYRRGRLVNDSNVRVQQGTLALDHHAATIGQLVMHGCCGPQTLVCLAAVAPSFCIAVASMPWEVLQWCQLHCSRGWCSASSELCLLLLHVSSPLMSRTCGPISGGLSRTSELRLSSATTTVRPHAPTLGWSIVAHGNNLVHRKMEVVIAS